MFNLYRWFNLDKLPQVSDEALVHDLPLSSEPSLPLQDEDGISPKDGVRECACIAYESSLLELAKLKVSKCKVCGGCFDVEVKTRGTSFHLKWVCLFLQEFITQFIIGHTPRGS